MPAIESSVVIARPVEEVFAFVSDFANGPKWQGSLDEAKVMPPGPTRLGTRIRETRTMMNQRVQGALRVTEWVPNSRYTLEGAFGPATTRAAYTFDAVDGGAKVSVETEASLKGFLKFMEPSIAEAAKRHLDTDLAHLKALLEGRG